MTSTADTPMPRSSERATPPARVVETSFAALDGFEADDLLEAYGTFIQSARSVAAGQPSLRPAVPPSDAFKRLCVRCAVCPEPQTGQAARAFFEGNFRPCRIEATQTERESGGGFLTGYYEPLIEGALERTAEFTAPIVARPANVARLPAGHAAQPYPPRARMEAEAVAGRHLAIAWVRDWVEAFFVHVQGSARLRLPGGEVLRLVYDGRNGQPYSSIGRILVDEGELAAGGSSIETVKNWIRAHGQEEGEAGRTLMQRNPSYVFFRAEPDRPGEGPTGGAGVPLTPLRSIAVDRTIWPYGLPFWIEADLPWETSRASRFRRLMVAQDTGSAIVGPARADLFFGCGGEAGHRAGGIRHPGRITVLLPLEDAPGWTEAH